MDSRRLICVVFVVRWVVFDMIICRAACNIWVVSCRCARQFSVIQSERIRVVAMMCSSVIAILG